MALQSQWRSGGKVVFEYSAIFKEMLEDWVEEHAKNHKENVIYRHVNAETAKGAQSDERTIFWPPTDANLEDFNISEYDPSSPLSTAASIYSWRFGQVRSWRPPFDMPHLSMQSAKEEEKQKQRAEEIRGGFSIRTGPTSTWYMECTGRY